jgi:hypothetical protein
MQRFLPMISESVKKSGPVLTISTAFVESTIKPSGQQTIRQEAADAVDATRGPSFAADQDKGAQRGFGRPIPTLVSEIRTATTNAGDRAQGGLTPTFWRSLISGVHARNGQNAELGISSISCALP